jgi:hypothetical protein
MSKIKRYNTFQTMGGVYDDPEGRYLDGQQIIPGTKVTNLEWCEHATDIIKMYMPDDMGLELPDAPDIAALEARIKELEAQLTMSLKDFGKVSRDRNNLLVQVQEAKDKLKAAEAWKERAIEWLTENPCHFKRCEIRGRDTTPHDCRTCIEAYFSEDKP